MEHAVQPRLVARAAIGVERCWCGTPLAPGAALYAFVDVPDVIASLVRPRSFCGVACVRAFLLETLETFQSAWIGSVVVDGEAATSSLRRLYFDAEAESGSFAGYSPPAKA